jgi:hypothetical protein
VGTKQYRPASAEPRNDDPQMSFGASSRNIKPEYAKSPQASARNVRKPNTGMKPQTRFQPVPTRKTMPG